MTKFFRLLLLISFLGAALSLRAAPDPTDLLDHPPATLGEFIRVWAQTHTGGGGNGSINWQNGGVGLGSFTTANCSTNITCSNVAGVLTITGSAGGGVTSITGDGTVITNSGSTGAVTLTTAPISGTGSICFTISCVMVTPNLGTPSAVNLANATALPLSALANNGTTVTVLHGNAAGNPSFAVTTPADAAGNTSGSGNFCLVTNCAMTTPNLGTPSALTLTNATGYAFPLTVTGGVSGAIPCFTSTTVESAGALLATHAIAQGGGAGACPSTGNGDFTVDSTAHTLLAGAAGLADFSAETGSNALKIPTQAGCTAGSNGAMCFNTTTSNLTVAGNVYYKIAAVPGTNCLMKNGSASGAILACSALVDAGTNVVSSEPVSATQFKTATNCAANGTAANPSVVSCSSAAAGMFSCATNASTGTCTVNTTAITSLNSIIMVIQDASDGGASQLNVTCNTGNVLSATAPLLAAKVAATGFTINLGTVSVNPGCFEYWIVSN